MLKLRAGCYESWFRSFGKGFDNVQYSSLITEEGLEHG